LQRLLPGPLLQAVQQWNELWQCSRPVLHVEDDGGHLRITDTRPEARRRSWTVHGLAAEVYRLCHSAQTPAALLKQLSARRRTAVSAHEAEAALETLCEANMLLRLNGRLLSLGVAQAALAA
jgi:hypothetical protein